MPDGSEGLRLLSATAQRCRVRFRRLFCRLTWGEERGDNYLAGVEIPILQSHLHLLLAFRDAACQATRLTRNAAVLRGTR